MSLTVIMIQIEYLPIVLTGIGIIVSILYYTSVLRNQNRTREAQLFLQFTNPFLSGEKGEYWNKISEWEFSDYDDYYTRILSDPENRKNYSQISYWLETLGVYVHEGLIPIRLVALTMTSMVASFWEKFGPIIIEKRVRENVSRNLDQTEYLYNELMKYIEQHPELAT